MHSKGLSLQTKQDLTSKEVFGLLAPALSMLEPKNLTLTVLYQFLLPLDELKYDEARTIALRQLSGGVFGSLGGYDLAVLLDGKKPGLKWQCEFGIVSAEEVEDRLKREVGFFSAEPGFYGTADVVPPVAFFADSRWETSDRPYHPEVEGSISETLHEVHLESQRVIGELFTSMCGDRNPGALAAGGDSI